MSTIQLYMDSLGQAIHDLNVLVHILFLAGQIGTQFSDCPGFVGRTVTRPPRPR